MLFVAFQAGNCRFALEARRVVEVVPRVALQPCPGAPGYVAGLLNYRGTCVPVVDLCRLVGGEPCRRRLSTRVILTFYPGREGKQRIVGLLAEGVTETLAKEPGDFCQEGLASGTMPGLGKLTADTSGFVQRVLAERLLPRELESLLFRESEPAT